VANWPPCEQTTGMSGRISFEFTIVAPLRVRASEGHVCSIRNTKERITSAVSGPILSRGLTAVLAVSCGLTVANLYFNQPLLALIAQSFGVEVSRATPVAMATQLGYASGLTLIGPLGDRVPRKPLILILGAVLTLALFAAAASQSLVQLVIASFALGLAASLAQQLVPLAAQLAPAERRGRVVGTVMAGLLVGLLGGRVVAGFVGEAWGWRSVFLVGATGVMVMSAVLALALPNLPPATNARYGKLLASTLALAREHATLRAAALNGALLFGSFSVFWVALTPLLTGPSFQLDGRAAGLFGLIGIAGAFVAPLAGRLNDKYGTPRVLAGFVAITIVSYGVFAFSAHSLVGLAVGTLVLDLGIQGAQISNQSRIFALQPDARSRINAFYMTCYFVGGASGSLLAGVAWAHFGWAGAVTAGSTLALLAGLAHVPALRTAGRVGTLHG
jgi:predicted MFS family arabinose efflux permease